MNPSKIVAFVWRRERLETFRKMAIFLENKDRLREKRRVREQSLEEDLFASLKDFAPSFSHEAWPPSMRL